MSSIYSNPYDIVAALTSRTFPARSSQLMLNDFTRLFNWRPSDRLDVPRLRNIANAHLVVEHGLENKAVITFLREPWGSLSTPQKEDILEVSYNNLVDWHIPVESDAVTFVFNRNSPLKPPDSYSISRENYENLKRERFEQIIGNRPNPNLRALDEELIRTISRWKRVLAGEMQSEVSNIDLSALFNGIIFVRATEDQYRKMHPEDRQLRAGTLLDLWDEYSEATQTIGSLLHARLTELTQRQFPSYLLSEEHLRVFDSLDRGTVRSLIADFYRSSHLPYDYDFSLISKHALSEIYEHYVSILRVEELNQSPLQPTLPYFSQQFTRLPEERWDRTFGSVHTPHFIARFFAKYLREQLYRPPLENMRAIDPACGSGIFLRSLLELEFEHIPADVTSEDLATAFENVYGLDIDANAGQSARLSLALLHLAITDTFAKDLNIHSVGAIEYLRNNPDLLGTFNAVMANPPFVPLDAQSTATRQINVEFMGKYAEGRIDAYLPFLLLGLQLLEPGGFGLFVLPHSFLLGQNARKMRELLAKTCWIRCLVDLAPVRIFQDVSAYVILLVFQKKPDGEQLLQSSPLATIAKCQDSVGQALQDIVDGQITENKSYSIYTVDQEAFTDENWIILPSTQASLQQRIVLLPSLGEFLNIGLGYVSGADPVFVIAREAVPNGEEKIYAPLLADREMKAYGTPNTTNQCAFYPFINGRKLRQDELQKRYTRTWEYLLSHKDALESRLSVQRGKLEWWQPERPRLPEHLMRPKIVTPHLALAPRFSLDAEGKFAVTRSPVLFAKNEGLESELLRYFLAILNSTACFWYIATYAHKYRSGYVMLEPKTLKDTPVPDPTQVPPGVMLRLLDIVDQRISVTPSKVKSSNTISHVKARGLQLEIDRIVADLYGLSKDERRSVGMET